MDKSLRYALEILFHRTSPFSVIKHFLNSKNHSNYYMSHYEKNFQRYMKIEYNFLSSDEISNITNIINDLNNSQQNQEYGVFSTIFAFAKSVLCEYNGEPSVKFEELLRFRDTTHTIGADLFICAFLAQVDYERGRKRINFDYGTAISTDNIRLRNMLRQGLAENHFHIKGSTPAFMLSWICLMNNVKKQKRTFDNMKFKETSLNSHMLFTEMNDGESFYSLVLKAAAIRLFFTGLLNEENEITKDEIEYFTNFMEYDDMLVSTNASRLQIKIDSYKKTYCENTNGYKTCMDYAIKSNQYSKGANVIFTGERSFLYDMFYAIVSENQKIKPYLDLFYAYILISSWFRGELVQNNNRTGFGNFSDYQDRKGIFINNNKYFEEALVSIALESNLDEAHIKSLEARFIPKKGTVAIEEQVEYFDKLANIKKDDSSPNNDRLFYVTHFPKSIDADFVQNKCRHHKLREDVKLMALDIAKIRQRQSYSAYRILGVDACANEIGCRPEVFAQPFRYLKNHSVIRNDRNTNDILPPQLHITYHAGEDFLDVADGLRAIDEAMNFLDMRQGDRFGHALALGIDPEHWYKCKNYRIFISKQDLIDNAAWMIYKLSKYGYSNKPIIYDLKLIYKTYYLYVYQNNIPFQEKDHFIDDSIYIDSWKLRGDAPYLYFECDDRDKYLNKIKNDYLLPNIEYNLFAKNKPEDEELTYIRENNIPAYKLMHGYHFNEFIRKCGAEYTEYKITNSYIEAVKIIQYHMRKELAQKGIGIECNPSSNYLIGTFKRYDNHPMINFNNHGLSSEENPKIFISINTDDLGVFDTSLENEYALMACALQKAVDENDNPKYTPNDVYEYLNYVRQMGIEQSFGYINKLMNGKILKY